MTAKVTAASPADRDFYTPAEFRELVDIGEDTMYRWRREGYGPPICRLSPRKIVYLKADVERWMQEQRQGKPRRKRRNGHQAPAA